MSYIQTQPANDWEGIIDKHHYWSLQALVTRDFGVIKASTAHNIHDAVNHRAALATATGDESATTKLDDLNAGKAQSAETAVTDYKNEVEANKDKGLSKDSWESLLDTQEDKAVKLVTEKIHNATLEAKGLIQALPEDAREPAANVYVEGSNIVMNVLNTLVDQLGGVINKVVEFLKGIFQAVTDAYNTVVSTVKSAVSFIKGIFSLNATSTAPKMNESNSTCAPLVKGVHKTYSVRANVGGGWKFIGLLNWPATVSIATATLGLAYVSKYLMDRRVRITYQKVTKRTDSGEVTTETQLEFDPDNKGFTLVGDDPATLWTQAVGELGNDGHYIPTSLN